MKPVVAVLIVGIVGLVISTLNPALEMWGPLIVGVVPLLMAMLWPQKAA